MSMRRSPLLALAALAVGTTLAAWAPAAAAQSKLKIDVITSSPEGFWVDSTLVSGEKEAILIDAQFTLSDAHRLAAAILESKKTLTTIYVTHFHPDHYFGLGVLAQAFPKAKILAMPQTIAEIKKTWKEKLATWGPMYGANLPAKPIVPKPLKGTSLTLEGETLEIHGPVQGDAANNSYVWIPSLKAVIAGDIVYNGIHPWTAETTTDSRRAWIATIDAIAALSPTTVVAGHKKPGAKDDAASLAATKAYLAYFDEALTSSKSAEELETKVKAKYGQLGLDVILHLGAEAAFKPPATPSK